MNRMILASMIASSLITATAVAQPRLKKDPELTNLYDADQRRFKAYFVEKPNSFSRKIDSKAGPIQITTVSYETRELIFSVVETAMPDKVKDAAPAKMLTAACDALSANGGKVISYESIKMTGKNDEKIEAREVTVEYGKTRIRSRVAVVGTTLIHVSVTGSEKYVTTKTADQFLRAVEWK